MQLKRVVGAAAVGLSILGLGFWFGSASAAGTEPGSSADPLVSKSYVEQLVAKLADKTYVDQIAARLADKAYVDATAARFADKAYVDQKAAGFADKAYVDQAVSGAAGKTYIDGKLAEIAETTKAYVDIKLAESNNAYKVVNVPKGAAIIGESGTEIVLRGGKATAIVTAKGGLLDGTDGVDLAQGEAVKPNHILVVPVSDGRGLLAQTDLILIVKGPYSVKVAGQ